MNIEDLIPKDKLDIETAEKLKDYSYEEIKPIVPDLLDWIQDMNWPVAKTVADYLITISEFIIPEIIEILNGKDEMWKYWTIGVFGIYSKKPLHPEVLEIIYRIANYPSFEEKESEVDEQAIRALNK
ncbi:MAG TPA: DUF5071 domain-containing protein [Flavobacterium sp.]|uniref:DUF5071 domain-containing protein n=1 Tax=unclassified Flavobacterium TaxID=196869 RepID=UPI0025BE7112|nr:MULTISPECIES: DUF5071 domain-containing protein [unclassified Flavobacterium]HRE76946.1 DUF5071 domain-containing protein [Flavobacterium sp.]